MKDVIRIIVRIQPQIIYHLLKEERLSLSLNYSKGITPSVPPPLLQHCYQRLLVNFGGDSSFHLPSIHINFLNQTLDVPLGYFFPCLTLITSSSHLKFQGILQRGKQKPHEKYLLLKFLTYLNSSA